MQRFGADDTFWRCLAETVGYEMVLSSNAQTLGKCRDEAIAWISLNRYLKFDASKKDITFPCLVPVLLNLTDMELAQVSRLPYGVDSDRFDEINELVDDPMKARLLDGIKRASKNDLEMSRMLVSLRGWVERKWWDGRKEAILKVGFNKVLKNVPIDQLRAETATVPDFKGDQELVRLFNLMMGHDISEILEKSSLEESFPTSIPDRGHIISILTRLSAEIKRYALCKRSIQSALLNFRESADWDDIVSYNVCIMRELSKVPDEFFEEYERLLSREQTLLNSMLQKAGLPILSAD